MLLFQQIQSKWMLLLIHSNSLSIHYQLRMDSLIIFTAPGGVFVQVGLPSVYDEGLQFPPAEIVIKEIMIVGSCVGPRPVIKEMIPLWFEKDIYPIVEEFDFEDFPKAFDKLENGKPHFRCVVNVKDWALKHGFKQ